MLYTHIAVIYQICIQRFYICIGKMALGKTILVTGVSGVGKTTIANKLGSILHLPHITASNLLACVNRRCAEPADILAKQSEQIASRIQQMLLSVPMLLVDGHCVLLDDKGDCVPIAVSLFKEIQLSKIILLIDNPRQILVRQQRRGDLTLDENKIARLQDEEINHSTVISNQLNITCTLIDIAYVGFEGAALAAAFAVGRLHSSMLYRERNTQEDKTTPTP